MTDTQQQSHRDQITVPVDAETKAKLQAAASREDRTLANYCRRVFAKALDDEREGATV